MIFKIADGSSVDISAGKSIVLKAGYVPSCFDGLLLEVVKIQDGYPYVQFTQVDDEGNVISSELSAVSSDIILQVK